MLHSGLTSARIIVTMRHVLVYTVALLIAQHAVNANAADTPHCRDENNLPVDWYALYKLPKLPHNSNPLIKTGDAYLFMTDRTVGQGWQLSTRSIGAANSILGNTLAPLYNNVPQNNGAILWALYNDEPPVSGSQWATGHAKGVVMVDNDLGFWLIHSVPTLASVSNGVPFNYPTSGKVYGQNFLCVSLGSDQFDTVGKQLAFNEIRTYAVNIPSALRTKYPSLVAATGNKRKYNQPYYNKAIIRSLNHTQFVSFAKARNWNSDLYDDFVAPVLQTNLYVQSWLKTGDPIPSICSNRNIYNVDNGTYVPANAYYPSSRDHSKWATSDNAAQNPATSMNWVCSGDINRAYSQRKRGGGTLCFQHPTAWRNYDQLIYSIDFCRD